MLYPSIKPLRIYKSTSVPLPKGEHTGFGNIIFLLSPSVNNSIELLSNDFIDYRNSLYKNYYIDFRYKEKIGNRKINVNKIASIKRIFKDNENISNKVNIIKPSVKKNYFEKNKNTIIDLGQWINLYNEYSLKISPAKICDGFISYLSNKINQDEYQDFNKVLYIDISSWFIQKSIGFSKRELNNPLSIILLSIYRFEDIMKKLGIITLLIGDSKNNEFLKIDYTSFNKKDYSRIKSKILSLTGLKDKLADSINDDEKPISDINESEDEIIINNIVEKNKNDFVDTRKIIINTMKKNLIGDVDDITLELPEEDNSSDDIKINNNMDDEINRVANNYIDNNPEILLNNPEVAAKEIEEEVMKKVYISKFMPQRSEKEIDRMNKLYGTQTEIIGKPSYEDLKSKIIEDSDFSDSITTMNYNITTSKFRNFDSSYNKKKLDKAIDEAVAIMANTDSKIFIINKEEEDTSDPLNLKKTITYHLQDEQGRKQSIKLDIPIIIDDNYIYLNGNKKILGHQLVLKPIVKTSPDTVQIVTFYNKIFITRRGKEDLSSSALRKFLLENSDTYKTKIGNAVIKNTGIETPIEFDIIASKIYEFSIGDDIFINDIKVLLEKLNSLNIDYKNIDLDENLIIGYNKKSRTILTMNKNKDIYSDIILSNLPEEDVKKIKKTSIRRLMYSQCKMLEKDIPVILFLLFCEGFTTVMKKANIEYKFVDFKEAKTYNDSEYGKIKLNDGIVVWKRYPLQNSLLLNGMSILPTDLYSYEELDSKETYIFMLSQFYTYTSMAFNLEQYKDFMIDNTTKEILIDHKLPTDLVSLMIYANNLLKDNSFRPENDHNNIRIRSNELIPYFTYKVITSAYNKYRKTQHKNKPTKILFKQDSVMKLIKTSQLTEDSSVLNPILELEKNRAVTYKGKMGINLSEAFTMDKRGYHKSMLGILGISTPDEANVGVVRQMTLEPKITSTLGYLEITPKENLDELNSANLMTPSELLTPLALQHDDPSRSSIKSTLSK